MHIGAYLGAYDIGRSDNDWQELGVLKSTPVKPGTVDLFRKQVKAAIKSTPPPVKVNNDVVNRVYAFANKVQQALRRAGVPEPALSYAIYQTYFETAAYTNAGVKQYNNYSGIKFAGQKGAKLGPNGYAVFDSIDDWARSMKHEITKGSNPAGAKSLEEYAQRLKANRYFESDLGQYTAGLKRARLVLKVLPAEQRAGLQTDGSIQDRQDMDIPGTTDYSKAEGWWGQLPWYAKAGIGVGAGLIVLAAVK